jgi:hypothetical protein
MKWSGVGAASSKSGCSTSAAASPAAWSSRSRVLYAFLIPGHRDRTAALEGDLTRLGVAAR